MAGVSSKAAGRLENKRKFNGGTELNNDLDISFYETPNRSYDSQLGRFLQVDEIGEANWEWTPYNFALNNPISLNDPLGLVEQGSGSSESSGSSEVKTSDPLGWNGPGPKKKKEPIYTTAATNLPGVVVYGQVKKLTPDQVMSFHTKLENAGISIDNVKSSTYRRQLQQYDRVYKFMVQVHKDIRSDGILFLEVASNFIPIPVGWVAKIKYVKYAANLFKIKREAAIVEAATEGGTTVFRAVDAAEAASVNETGQFLLKEGGAEVKYFAKSLEDAHWYGSKLYPKGYSIIKGTVRTSVNAAEHWFPHVDIGAYIFPKEALPYIIPH